MVAAKTFFEKITGNVLLFKNESLMIWKIFDDSNFNFRFFGTIREMIHLLFRLILKFSHFCRFTISTVKNINKNKCYCLTDQHCLINFEETFVIGQFYFQKFQNAWYWRLSWNYVSIIYSFCLIIIVNCFFPPPWKILNL